MNNYYLGVNGVYATNPSVWSIIRSNIMNEIEIPATKLALIQKFVGRPPTKREIAVSQERYPAAALPAYRDEDPDQFDPDVIGILKGVYKDVEMRGARKEGFPYFFSANGLAAIAFGVMGTAEILTGHIEAGCVDISLAFIEGVVTTALNDGSGGSDLRRLKKYIPIKK